LFVTLDPLTRQVRLPGAGELLLSDTVGFIDRLPHALVAAFRATLEEVAEADLLLHVIDATSPERERHVAAVKRVLAEVGAEELEIIDVYNKVDAVGEESCARLVAQFDQAVFVSARTGKGIDSLLERVAVALALDMARVTLSFDAGDPADRARIAHLYRVGRVVSQATSAGRTVVEADVPRRVRDRLLAASR
jgi:GTP-binding protein HflX